MKDLNQMKSFKEFLNEQEDLTIDVNSDQLLNHIDDINQALDAVIEEKYFVNSAIFFNAVRGTLERFGILIPPGYEMPMLSKEAETVYALGDSGYYLYITHETEDDGVEGYAQVVNQDDLDDLLSMEDEEDEEEEDEEENPMMGSAYLRQTRRTNDDSGNNDEYT